MEICETRIDDPFFCPTRFELFEMLQALLPPGRAWQTHEAIADVVGSVLAQHGAYEAGGEIGVGAEGPTSLLTTMQQFWWAAAVALEDVHQRACDLTNEFFCETTTELREEWGIDWGFPDPCLPYDKLCEKVTAQGGVTCAYIAEIAAYLGWDAACADTENPNEIQITITLASSPGYSEDYVPNRAGRMTAGVRCQWPCGPDPATLICLIERLKPAHVRALYTVV